MAESLARQLVRQIDSDLREQPGLGAVWEALGPEMQDEIRDRWTQLLHLRLRHALVELIDADAAADDCQPQRLLREPWLPSGMQRHR